MLRFPRHGAEETRGIAVRGVHHLRVLLPHAFRDCLLHIGRAEPVLFVHEGASEYHDIGLPEERSRMHPLGEKRRERVPLRTREKFRSRAEPLRKRPPADAFLEGRSVRKRDDFLASLVARMRLDDAGNDMARTDAGADAEVRDIRRFRSGPIERFAGAPPISPALP
jgi:hypothetical protein